MLPLVTDMSCCRRSRPGWSKGLTLEVWDESRNWTPTDPEGQYEGQHTRASPTVLSTEPQLW